MVISEESASAIAEAVATNGGSGQVDAAAPAATPAVPTETQATETPAAAESAAPTETPAPAAPAFDFTSAVKEIGFQVGEKDDAVTLQQRVIEALRQREAEQRRLATELEQQRRTAAMAQELLVQRSAPQQPAAQPQVQRRPYEPPPFDADLLPIYRQTVVDPATGQQVMKWKDGTPPEYIRSAEDYANHIQEWQDKLVTNPKEALAPLIEDMLQERMSKFYQEQQQQVQAQSFQEQQIQQNAEWLFRRDPMTNQVVYGQLSDKGAEFDSLMREAAQYGVQDFRGQWNYAARIMGAKSPASPAAPVPAAAPPAPTPADKRNEFRQKTARIPGAPAGNSTGTFGGESPQNPQLSFGQQVMQAVFNEI